MRRTVPVALDVDSDDAALLEDTVDTFLWCTQYVVDHAFEGEYVTTIKTTLDDETYDDVREKTDGFTVVAEVYHLIFSIPAHTDSESRAPGARSSEIPSSSSPERMVTKSATTVQWWVINKKRTESPRATSS